MAFTKNVNNAVSHVSGDAVSKAVRTVTGDSGWIDVGRIKELVAQLHSDAGTGTTPTLDIKLQTSFDGTDATAVDVPSGAFTQVVDAASNQIKSLVIFHNYIKFVWTITGTTPSFNFGVYLTSRDI
ncbi:MAG: hypothetical protein K6U74_00040 [Firmicutes bacterium]|nr:hypothetical protein [Bacillota bacterium]